MLKKRMIALAATGSALGAVALGVGPASAATVDVSSLPESVRITTSDSISVTDSNSLLCGNGDLRVFVPGRQDAVSVSGVSCDSGNLQATITPTNSSKKNAVVKFKLVKADDSVAVLTLVVHVKR